MVKNEWNKYFIETFFPKFSVKRILPQLLADITRRPRYEVKAGRDFQWADNLWTHNFFRFLETIFGAGCLSADPGDTIYPSVWTGVDAKDGIVYVQAYTFEAAIAVTEAMLREVLATFRLPKIKKVYIPQFAFAGTPMQSAIGLPYVFAIAWDAVGSTVGNTLFDNGGVVTSMTWNHTNTGSNLLFLGFASTTQAANGSVTITGCTYNSSSLTGQVTGDANNLSGNGARVRLDMLLKMAPSSGTNSTVMSMSGALTTSNKQFACQSLSYTGTAQTGQPDSSHASTSGANPIPMTNATTVVLPNCWLVGGITGDQGGSAGSTSSTNTTLRDGSSAQGNMRVSDSNGTVSTGSQTQSWNRASSANENIPAVTFSIAPAVASTNSAFLMFMPR